MAGLRSTAGRREWRCTKDPNTDRGAGKERGNLAKLITIRHTRGVILAQRGWSAESAGPERPVWSIAVIRVEWTRSERQSGRKMATITASPEVGEVGAAAELANIHTTAVLAQTR